MTLPPWDEWEASRQTYLCDGRWLTPTAVGHEAAAFWRYRGRFGADTSSKIEPDPSWQWGLY